MGDHRPRVGYSPRAVVSPPETSTTRNNREGAVVSRQEEGRYGESSRHGQQVGFHPTRTDIPDAHSSRYALEYDRGSHPSRQIAPPPGVAYTSADDRQFAFSDRYISNSAAISSSSGRHPSVPPPQRPVSSHMGLPSSRSQPPPSPPSSRGAHPAHAPHSTNDSRDRYSPAHYYPSRPLSPPASRGEGYTASPRPEFNPSAAERVMDRSHSRTSVHSDDKSAGRARASSPTPSDQADDDVSSSRERDNASSEPPSGHGGPTLQRPKRTRVLMTHVQQQRLGTLWKRSKFPSTQEREEIAVEVGLTPRQVQVWFQNRRQTFRKQIQQNAIPHGSDPADYTDLLKSPRSRRLSLEAANAASDDRDRVSQWAQSSSSSMDSYAARPHSAHPLGASSEPVARINRPLVSGNVSAFAHSPPSPPRKYESDYRADYRHLPRSRHGDPTQYRPSTSSSTSSYYSTLPSYPGGLARQYSLGGRPADRRGSFWDTAIQQTSSPVPYSPPPTAQAGAHSLEKRIDGYGDGYKRRKTDQDTPTTETATQDREERPKTSHLPPSLAALAIARPLDSGKETRSGPQLPGLALRVDGEAADSPGRHKREWPRQEFEREYRDSPNRNDRPEVRGGFDIRIPSNEGIPDGMVKSAEMTKESTSSSSLPRFNDLFR